MPRPARLAQDELLALIPTAATRITCVHGALWITQSGNPADIILTPAQSFRPAPAQKVVIQALRPSSFTISPDLP